MAEPTKALHITNFKPINRGDVANYRLEDEAEAKPIRKKLNAEQAKWSSVSVLTRQARLAPYSSRSTSRNDGNSLSHNNATAIVATPPNTAENMLPNSAAATPLSN